MLETMTFKGLLLTPEVFLSVGISLVLLLAAFAKKGTQAMVPLFAQAIVGITGLLCLASFNIQSHELWMGMLLQDQTTSLIKVLLCLLTVITISFSRHYVRNRAFMQGEYWVLMMFSLLGMMVLVASQHLLALYLGVEIMALPLYAMVSMCRDNSLNAEAGMKYFVMGALSSGMLLYGISMLYGATGTVGIPEISDILSDADPQMMHIAMFGLVFIMVAVAFKFGAVPFHMWLPDVYQGAPTTVTLFIGSVTKVAAVGMAYRLLHDLLPELSDTWQLMLAGMAVLSLVLGNIVAIAQTNAKRMLAYSAISHIGFLFLAMLGSGGDNLGIYLFYVLVYALTAQGAFGVLTILSGEGGEIETIKDLRGLGKRRPFVAFMMMLFMFSLIGVPPTAGFYAKFLILQSLLENGLWLLALIAVIFSVIGAFYYLRIIKSMYFEEAELVFDPRIPLDAGCALTLTGALVLALGIMPTPIWALLQRLV